MRFNDTLIRCFGFSNVLPFSNPFKADNTWLLFISFVQKILFQGTRKNLKSF